MAKCSCCGRKKKFFESFEDIGKGGAVCVGCSDILYKINDAKREKDMEEYNISVDTINGYIDSNKTSIGFASWFKEDFMKRNTIEV